MWKHYYDPYIFGIENGKWFMLHYSKLVLSHCGVTDSGCTPPRASFNGMPSVSLNGEAEQVEVAQIHTV